MWQGEPKAEILGGRTRFQFRLLASLILVAALGAALLSTLTIPAAQANASPAAQANASHSTNQRKSDPVEGSTKHPYLKAVAHFAKGREHHAADGEQAAAVTPSAPFYECPAIGEDQSCGILIYVPPSGQAEALTDPTQPPYDGDDDTLVGILNESNSPVTGVTLSSNEDIFGFDGDGICTYSNWDGDSGCPYGSTGYEGPGTYFANYSTNNGTVFFDTPLDNGASAYFGLENALEAVGQTSAYVALGDSYSSGQGTNDYTFSDSSSNDHCNRGPEAWPMIMAGSDTNGALSISGIGSTNSFYACAGADIADFGTPDQETKYETEPSQVWALRQWTNNNGDPALVTITAGGDDIGWSNVLTACAWYSIGHGNCVAELDAAMRALSNNQASFIARLATLYENVASAAGNDSNVAVVGYPIIMAIPGQPGHPALDCPWLDRTGNSQFLNIFYEGELDLNSDIEAAAAQAGVPFWPILGAFGGNQLCTGDSDLGGLNPEDVLKPGGRADAGHPNVQGQDAIASSVASCYQDPESCYGNSELNLYPTKKDARAVASLVKQDRDLVPAKASSLDRSVKKPRDDPASALSIDTSGLPEAFAGGDYVGFLYANGGNVPYNWSITEGSLPNGLSLDPTTGIISGEADTPGTSSFTVEATDSTSPTPESSTAQVTMTVSTDPTLAVTSESLPPATVGQAYSATLSADGGTSPIEWTLNSGTLPPGLSLSSSGEIQGTPTASGASFFTVQATDSSIPNAQESTGSFSLSVTASGSPLLITSSQLPSVEQGDELDASLTSSGGTQPIVWSLAEGSSLPDGVSLDSGTGIVSGNPTAAGQFSFAVTATDRSTPVPETATADVSLSVTASPPPSLVTTNIPSASQGTNYAATIDGIGGVAPYSWSISQGELPPGLALDPEGGTISGVPTQAGTYAFTLTLDDSTTPSAQSASENLTLIVEPSAPLISSSSLPTATASVPYSATVEGSGGVTPYSWLVASGSLPPGLTMDPSSGNITGTPTQPGTFDFAVQLVDSSTPSPQTTSENESITVTAAPQLTIETDALPDAISGSQYRAVVPFSGGVGPFVWTLSEGSLPSGLSLDPTSGVVSGVAISPGSYSFAVQVTDSSQPTAEATSSTISLNVDSPPPLVIAGGSLPDGTAGSPYSESIGVSGGLSPYSWGVTAGELPAGLSLSSATGVISGTPTGTGTSTFTIEVSDSALPSPDSISTSYTITIDPGAPLEVDTSSPLPEGMQGTSYQTSLIADGGVSPYSWSVITGSLPPGLTLDPSSGTISGEPTSFGNYSFSVEATDSSTPSPQVVTSALEMTIGASGPLTISTTSLPGGTQGQYYDQTVSVAGGAGPYSYSISSGELPTGLTLDQSGDISGEITSSQSESFTVQVTDQTTPVAQSTSVNLTVDVTPAPPLSLSAKGLPSVTQGQYYQEALTLTGGTPPYTWRVIKNDLPPGLTFSSGYIYGSTTKLGKFTLEVEVLDSSAPNPEHAVLKLTVNVDKLMPLKILTAKLPPGVKNKYYDETLVVSGGTPGYSWSIESGRLPPGLVLATSGQIYGTPTSTGSSSSTLKVTDSSEPTPQTATKTYKIVTK